MTVRQRVTPGKVENGPDASTRAVLIRQPKSSNPAPAGWHALPDPASIQTMQGVQYLFVEGGAETAAAFLRAGLVDDLLLYRAPILIGGGKPGIADLGLTALAGAHGQWQRTDFRQLGNDTVERYERC